MADSGKLKKKLKGLLTVGTEKKKKNPNITIQGFKKISHSMILA